jgi:hypothetical protein
MPIKQSSTYRSKVWSQSKRLLVRFGASPQAQSIAAAIINLLLLITSVLGLFWLVISSLFFVGQIYNSWLVKKVKLAKWKALIIGLGIILLNIGLLYLTFLGKFWIITSIVLSLWQYLSLIQVCIQQKSIT